MTLLLLLLALQAAGQEVTTFYPLPSKEQQQVELRKAQGLPASVPAPAAKPKEPKPAPKPEVPIEVVSVKAVPADANAIFVPETQKPK